MTSFSLICQLFFVIMFLSTAFSKITNFKEHATIVKTLAFLSKTSGNILTIFLIIAEVFIPISFMINLHFRTTVYAAIILLVIYCFGIIINLMASNEKMDCGCGGILHSHKLSGAIVIRNLIFVSLLILMVNYPISIEWQVGLIPYLLSSVLITVFFYLFSEYRESMNKIKQLEEGVQ
ncbi:MauE/DoxX family redox-associated membrane protein [Cytobacillus sp. IB215665]|uniref:MauE/DoxX family redox-associated membrane protein n=1 Tax=Cytobacillus sp. IB215665 TaxID=3097357 RepID=UPI002A176D70|nr:MauE/DoxX family redox-associated membrane protein [Cytobacillus sp. IB215665]MDX8365386.1 MauE/DoxX family redox-associated membrane protein [Cytobacillus sp. IB215665]